MTLIVTAEYALDRVAAPRLPTATPEYNKAYLDQLNNILRLYFNRIDNVLGQLTATATTATLQVPYGSFYQDGTTQLTANISNVSTTPIQVASTDLFAPSGSLLIEGELIGYTAKTPTTFTGITRGVYGTTNVAHTTGTFATESLGVPSATVGQAIIFTGTLASYGMELSALNTSRVVCTTAGVYNFAFSAQMLNFTTSEDNVTVWFRKNGVDVDFSAGVVQVNSKHGSAPGAVIVAWNILLEMSVTDYIEMYFSSETGNTVCSTYPAGVTPTTPISPSIILTATFVSALP